MTKKAPVMSPQLLLVIFISLALIIFVAESRFFGIGPVKIPTLACDTVYGAQSGDTCTAIQQKFNLTPADFSKFNPNLVCGKIFPGQWLCIDGSVH